MTYALHKDAAAAAATLAITVSDTEIFRYRRRSLGGILH
ncbi:hypothetical protein BVIR_2651 [Blastochloris viridis]|uniref:Uncharacterized protein n=1 Tax=Blastochloris viridis TaxID=1079 RepID=A0A0H5BPP4_BLAVI|nr:hypothetical protein BVIR_2651 [Blastochloris viridis]BAR99643.1 hypothetical protein BV133_2050 [Blastochloris viridis]CUU43078.1 hypothetical protein BVIRIDIS_20950 [Blastochloris viridis]